MDYRPLTDDENATKYSFSDHFRFVFDTRMDRDEAKDLRDAIELLIADKTGKHCPVVDLLVHKAH